MTTSRVVLLALAFALVATEVKAQSDFAAEWAAVTTEDNLEDAIPGFLVGMPITRAAELRIAAYQEQLLTLPEWQCRPHGAPYVMRSPTGWRFRISRILDRVTNQVVGFETSFGMRVYIDGRPVPSPMAPHTWMGFSVGGYEGDALKFTTTHIKEAAARRIGVPASDRTTLTQYWIRHGDVFTWITVHEDPMFMSEPMIRSMDFRMIPTVTVPEDDFRGYNPNCTIVEETDAPPGWVPHYLPGTNMSLGEYGAKYRLPLDVTRGGAATMYPEVARRLIEAANASPTR